MNQKGAVEILRYKTMAPIQQNTASVCDAAMTAVHVYVDPIWILSKNWTRVCVYVRYCRTHFRNESLLEELCNVQCRPIECILTCWLLSSFFGKNKYEKRLLFDQVEKIKLSLTNWSKKKHVNTFVVQEIQKIKWVSTLIWEVNSKPKCIVINPNILKRNSVNLLGMNVWTMPFLCNFHVFKNEKKAKLGKNWEISVHFNLNNSWFSA